METKIQIVCLNFLRSNKAAIYYKGGKLTKTLKSTFVGRQNYTRTRNLKIEKKKIYKCGSNEQNHSYH